MSRIFGLLFANITLALALSPSALAKPNIVLIYIDDYGWRDVGFNGSKFYETPNADRIAREGMVFRSAYSNGPNCAPSRACLMSGLYSPRHGIYTVANSDRGRASLRKIIPTKNTTVLANEFVTMAEALKRGGYATATMGKWHLGKDPTTQGFDVNIAGREWGSPSGGGYHSPYNYPNLVNNQKGEYLTDRLGTEAAKFIEEHKEKPFFLYLTHYAVHTPIQAKPELTAKYQKKPKVDEQTNAKYAAMIESMDDSVGTVLDTLDRLKLADNTIVIFYADNGGHAGATSNAPLRGSKGMLYEGGIRVPMAIRWPGVAKSGSVCEEPVIGIDLYPTLLEATKTKRPAKSKLDGTSLVPLLKDAQTRLFRPALYWHFPAYLQGSSRRHGPFRTTPAGAVRMGNWKLIEYFDDGTLELYNLADDIGETGNLAKQKPKKTAQLHAMLKAWRRTTDAPVPTETNPQFDPEAWRKATERR
jgi:arylsulfatase A-like enzyme